MNQQINRRTCLQAFYGLVCITTFTGERGPPSLIIIYS